MSAFAQVTITGNFDIGYASIGGNVAQKGTTLLGTGGASTTSLNFTAIDDIGGGLKSKVYMELAPGAFMVDGGATISNNETFVSLAGGFGEIKLGEPNSNALTTFGAASPLGTATGSGYTYTNSLVGHATRYARSVKYESPMMSGFQATALYAPGADNPTTTTVYAGVPYQRTVMEAGLNYANGPLNISFSNVGYGSQVNAATIRPISIANTPSNKISLLSANYTFGNSTLYVGYNKGETMGSAASTAGLANVPDQVAGAETKGTRAAYKYVAGTYTITGSYAKQSVETTISSNVFTERKVTGLQVKNDLSKRTAVYLAYENYDNGLTSLNKTTSTILGIKQSF